VLRIELAQGAGVKIAVTTHGRIYDPTNGRDRRTLQEDAVDAEYETYKISVRVLRALSANAADGRPHAVCPFGYRRRYDERTRQLIAQEPDPKTAPLIVELFDRLQRGDSLKGIARDWQARGITTPGSEKHPSHPFTPQHLRAMAVNRAYGGERVHHGRVTPASWPALVPEVTYRAVQAMFAERKGSSPRSGRARHLLSGIARCDVCGGVLSSDWRQGTPVYRCKDRRCVTVAKVALDDLAEAVIVAYLAQPGLAAKLTAADGADADLDAARAEVAKIRTELDDWRGKARRREVSAGSFAEIEPGILADLDKAEALVVELSTPSKLRGLIEPGEDVAERWATAPLSAKREITRTVCVPEYLGELRVSRATTPGQVHDRVTWRRG
jgi:hypothetical protein